MIRVWEIFLLPLRVLILLSTLTSMLIKMSHCCAGGVDVASGDVAGGDDGVDGGDGKDVDDSCSVLLRPQRLPVLQPPPQLGTNTTGLANVNSD